MLESSIMESSKVESSQNPKRNVGRGTGWLRSRWLVFAGLAVALGGGGAFYWSRSSQAHTKQDGKASGDGKHETSRVPAVQVIKPHRGGLERLTDQPGTIRGFEYARSTRRSQATSRYERRPWRPRQKRPALAQVYDPEVDVADLQAEDSLQHSQAVARQAELTRLRPGCRPAKPRTLPTEEAVAQRPTGEKPWTGLRSWQGGMPWSRG